MCLACFRALRTSRAYVPYVPTCSRALRACVPLCFERVFLFYVPYMPSSFSVSCVPLFFMCLQFYCLTYPQFFMCLTCLYFFTCLTCPYFLTCLTCLHYFTCLHLLPLLPAFVFTCLHFIYVYANKTLNIYSRLSSIFTSIKLMYGGPELTYDFFF